MQRDAQGQQEKPKDSGSCVALRSEAAFPVPVNEQERLQQLRSYEVLDTSPEHDFEQIVALAADLFDAPMATITLIDGERQWFKAKIGVEAQQTPRELSFCAHAIMDSKVFVVADAHADPRFATNPLVTGEPHIRFYAGAPLTTPSGHRLGALCVIDQRPRAPLTQKEERALQSMAAMVMDRLEIKRLKALDRMAMRIFATTSDAIVEADAHGRITLWNKAAEAMFGHSGAEALGQPLTLIIPEQMRDAHAKSFARMQAGGCSQLAGRADEPIGLHKNGRQFPIELSLSTWKENEKFGAGAIIRDLTERRAREASFELLFEHNPMPMWLYDPEDLRVLAVNQAAIDHYGYSRDRFLSMNLLDLRPSEDHEAVKRAVSERIAHLRTWRHLKADRSEIEVSIYSRALTYAGRPAVLTVAVDLTERKKAEDELRRTRAFVDAVVESIPAMLFVKDALEHRFVMLNKAGEKLLGLSRKDVIGKRDHDLFPSDDADYFLKRDQEVLHSGMTKTVVEHVQTRDQGARLLRTTKLPILSESGEPQYLLGISEDITEREQAEQQIAYLAHYDPLTDLPNKLLFNRRVDERITQSRKSGQPFALLCVGLRRFKSVIDSLGDEVGDLLLRAVAKRLRRTLRETDAVPGRLDTQEFCVKIAGAEKDAVALAARLVSALGKSYRILEHDLVIDANIGVAMFPGDGDSSEALLKNARSALRRAKSDGRGTYRFFEPEMNARLDRQRTLELELRTALSQGEFELYYQPAFNLRTNAISGFEALLRWRHPRRGLVCPGEFIPLAEELGLIASLGEWVVRQACQEAVKWPEPLRVAVNLSPAQFKGGNLKHIISRALVDSGLSASRLELEITESILLEESDANVNVLHQLHQLGARIALDDFGTGFSSLSYLRTFPFDKLKIDRSFVTDLAQSAECLAIVRAVIGLGTGLGMTIVAEGVETEGQLALLKAEGCDEVQGFLFSRPRPAPEIRTMLTARKKAQPAKRSARAHAPIARPLRKRA